MQRNMREAAPPIESTPKVTPLPISNGGVAVVLSLDGGALKGIIQLRIIQELDKMLDTKQVFKNAFSKELSGIFTDKDQNQILDILSKTNDTTDKPILDRLYDDWNTFYDGNGQTIFTVLGGSTSAPSATYDVIATTFFHVRDNIIGIDKSQKCFIDYVDIVGSVSIGSILSGCLLVKKEDGGYKYSTADVMKLLEELPTKYFEKNWIPFFKPVLNEEKVFNGIKDIFGDATFDEVKVKLSDAIMSASSCLMVLPAHEMKYKLFGENTVQERTEADGCYINLTPHLDLLSTLSTTGTKIEDLIMIGIGTGRCNFDAKNVANGSAYSYIKDITSEQQFYYRKDKGIQDNTSRAVDNIIRSNGGQSYLLDVDISLDQYQNSFYVANIKNDLALADKFCKEHHDELQSLAETLVANYAM